MPLALDHVQLAAPPGCEDAARGFWEDDGERFHTDDPWGNRLELLTR